MKILKQLTELFNTTDKQLIRGSGMTSAILYLLYYVFEDGTEMICFNKIAAAFIILFAYFIIEPILRPKQPTKIL